MGVYDVIGSVWTRDQPHAMWQRNRDHGAVAGSRMIGRIVSATRSLARYLGARINNHIISVSKRGHIRHIKKPIGKRRIETKLSDMLAHVKKPIMHTCYVGKKHFVKSINMLLLYVKILVNFVFS